MVVIKLQYFYKKVWRLKNDIRLGILEYVSVNELQIFMLIFLAVISLIFTWKTADIGGLVFIGISFVFVMFGWITISSITFGLAILISVINFLKRKRYSLSCNS